MSLIFDSLIFFPFNQRCNRMMANTPETGMVTFNLNSFHSYFFGIFDACNFLFITIFQFYFFLGPSPIFTMCGMLILFFFNVHSIFSCWLCHLPLIQQRNVQQRSVCFSECICSQFSNLFFSLLPPIFSLFLLFASFSFCCDEYMQI